MGWFKGNRNEWKKIIETIAREIKKPEEMVEKDTIQSMFLYRLFEINKNIVFKGGTSLSKAYRVIDRFSEDIDLSSAKKLTENNKKQLDKDIKTVATDIGLHLMNDNDIKSRYNYNKYYFEYESLFSDISLEIVIETNLFLEAFPINLMEVGSIVGDFSKKNNISLPIEFNEAAVKMNVQTIERTFIDKVFAVCDYKIQDMKDRDSRHLYDIAKLVKKIKFDHNLAKLIEIVRIERLKSENNPSANFKYDINKLLQEIIDTRFYESDYNKITNKLLYENYSYDNAINNGIKAVIANKVF